MSLIVTTGLCLLGLSACSSQEESTDGKVTIEYFNQKGEMVDTLREIAKDFEKENPNVHIKVVNVPNAGGSTQNSRSGWRYS